MLQYHRERPRQKHKLPKGFKPQFEGPTLTPFQKNRLHEVAKRNPRWRRKMTAPAGRPTKTYMLSDQPLNYDRYLKERYWISLRAETLLTRNTCERCGTEALLSVRHRYCYKDDKSVLYRERECPDVLEILCQSCRALEQSTAQ